MQNKIRILCTRPIDKTALDLCRANNIDLDVFSFITTEPLENVEVQQEIENALQFSTAVVFTSMNAVEAVAEFLFDEQPYWRIFCIGNTTKGLVKKYFGEEKIAGTAQDALALAEIIIEEGQTDELIFFCGDKRRDELPSVLRANEIEVQEIIVYETIQVQYKIEKEYHGILFFSPSAVESFFTVNKLNSSTILFAIGNTTAAALKKYTVNKIITGDEPGKQNLIEKMVEYFT